MGPRWVLRTCGRDRRQESFVLHQLTLVPLWRTHEGTSGGTGVPDHRTRGGCQPWPERSPEGRKAARRAPFTGHTRGHRVCLRRTRQGAEMPEHGRLVAVILGVSDLDSSAARCIRPRSSSGRQRRQRPVDRWKARRNLLERGGPTFTLLSFKRRIDQPLARRSPSPSTTSTTPMR